MLHYCALVTSVSVNNHCAKLSVFKDYFMTKFMTEILKVTETIFVRLAVSESRLCQIDRVVNMKELHFRSVVFFA